LIENPPFGGNLRRNENFALYKYDDHDIFVPLAQVTDLRNEVKELSFSTESGKGTYVVVRGFIHGREASLNQVYGMFICVSTSSETRYISAVFSREQDDTKMPLYEMISRLAEKKRANRDESLLHYEKELVEYIRINRIFLNERSLLDPKSLERKISYFCAESIRINVITFLEVTSMGEDDIRSFFPSMPEPSENESVEDADPQENEHEGDGEENSPDDVYISCNPALDPVSGLAAGEIEAGDSIYCMLPEGSAFYKLLKKNTPGFDGTVVGDVISVDVNEFGSAIITMTLADGVTGVLKLSGAVRVKLKAKGLRKGRRKIARMDIVLAVAGIVLFLCAMGVILHFLT
jgi:hypothetical protein